MKSNTQSQICAIVNAVFSTPELHQVEQSIINF